MASTSTLCQAGTYSKENLLTSTPTQDLYPKPYNYTLTLTVVSNPVHRLNTRDGRPANPTDLSRGIFGATVGIDRLLALLSKYNIKATWFTPAHTAESFPAQIRKIMESGHEIGLHGYTHEFVSELSGEQQRDVLEKSVEVLKGMVGEGKLKGWTAPAWVGGSFYCVGSWRRGDPGQCLKFQKLFCCGSLTLDVWL